MIPNPSGPECCFLAVAAEEGEWMYVLFSPAFSQAPLVFDIMSDLLTGMLSIYIFILSAFLL